MEEVEIAPGDKSNPVKSFIAGGVGGMCNVLVGYPLDTIKVSYKAIGSSWTSESCYTYVCFLRSPGSPSNHAHPLSRTTPPLQGSYRLYCPNLSARGITRILQRNICSPGGSNSHLRRGLCCLCGWQKIVPNGRPHKAHLSADLRRRSLGRSLFRSRHGAQRSD